MSFFISLFDDAIPTTLFYWWIMKLGLGLAFFFCVCGVECSRTLDMCESVFECCFYFLFLGRVVISVFCLKNRFVV